MLEKAFITVLLTVGGSKVYSVNVCVQTRLNSGYDGSFLYCLTFHGSKPSCIKYISGYLEQFVYFIVIPAIASS